MKLVPSRRWLWGAGALALVAPAVALLAGSLGLLLALDAVWIVLLLVDAAAAPAARALELQREVPVAFSLGRRFVVRYLWRQRAGRRLTVLVKERLPEPLGGAVTPLRRLELPPRLEVEERLELQPLRRGIGTGGTIDLRILGPLGLAWRQSRIEAPWTATVYPSLRGTSLRALPMQVLRRREAGLRSVRHRGEGRLFEGLREWVPGDDTRIIDWKATARRGKPIARQYEDERRQQVMLLVDAGRLLTAEVEGVPRLEAVVSAALYLAYAAVEHDDDVGLLVFADTIQRYVAPARGRRALRAVLEGLAGGGGPPGRVRLPGRTPLSGTAQQEARSHRALHRRHRPDGERGARGPGRHPAAASPAAGGDTTGPGDGGARLDASGGSGTSLPTRCRGGAARGAGGGAHGDALAGCDGARRAAGGRGIGAGGAVLPAQAEGVALRRPQS